MRDWAEVVAAGLALPGVEQGSRYGRPALLFRGRMLAATTAPDPASFVLHVALPDKEVLIDTDPATFWETDHYRGWPAILVRYGTAATGRIALAARPRLVGPRHHRPAPRLWRTAVTRVTPASTGCRWSATARYPGAAGRRTGGHIRG